MELASNGIEAQRKVKIYPRLYDTMNKLYRLKKPISRILYIAKTKESGNRDEKINKEIVFNNITTEIKGFFGNSEVFNCMIIFSGINYCTVAIEVRLFLVIFNILV